MYILHISYLFEPVSWVILESVVPSSLSPERLILEAVVSSSLSPERLILLTAHYVIKDTQSTMLLKIHSPLCY